MCESATGMMGTWYSGVCECPDDHWLDTRDMVGLDEAFAAVVSGDDGALACHMEPVEEPEPYPECCTDSTDV